MRAQVEMDKINTSGVLSKIDHGHERVGVIAF